MFDKIKDKIYSPTSLPKEFEWENVKDGIIQKLECKNGKRNRKLGFLSSVVLALLFLKTCSPIDIGFAPFETYVNSNVMVKEQPPEKSFQETSSDSVIVVTSLNAKTDEYLTGNNLRSAFLKSFKVDHLLENESVKRISKVEKELQKGEGQNHYFNTKKSEQRPVSSTAVSITNNYGNDKESIERPSLFFEQILPAPMNLVNNLSSEVLLSLSIITVKASRLKNNISIGTGIAFWKFNLGDELIAVEKSQFESATSSGTLGLRFEFALNHSFNLASGLDYIQLNSVFENQFLSTSSGASGTNIVLRDIRHHNSIKIIAAPLLLTYKHTLREFEFTISNGIQLSKIINAQGRTIQNGELISYDKDSHQLRSNLRLGLQSEVGLWYLFQDYSIGITYGVTKSTKNLSADDRINLNPIIHHLGLRLGYKFGNYNPSQ